MLLFATQTFADAINVPGESAHVAGGAAISGIATAIADKYWPEHRALIGFSVGTASGIIGEGIDRVTNGEDFSSMLQDVAFTTLGAAIGAFITDKYSHASHKAGSRQGLLLGTCHSAQLLTASRVEAGFKPPL